MTEMGENQDKKERELVPFLCNYVDNVVPYNIRRNNDFNKFLGSIRIHSLNKKPILMLTHSNDIDSTILGIYLAKNDLPCIRLNQEDFANNIVVKLEPCSSEHSYEIRLNNDQLLLDNIPLVFLRDFRLENFSFSLDNFVHTFIVQQWNNLLLSMINSLSCPWINTIESTIRAEDRYSVLQRARQLGFVVPDTVITNDPAEIRKFFFDHDGQIISKVLHHHDINSKRNTYSIYSHKVTPKDLHLLRHLEPSPSIFQHRVKRKKEIRVTVTGQDVFATELVLPKDASDVDDIHRYGVRNIKKLAITLSNEFEKKCIGIIKSLELTYGTIDIIEGLDEQYYFLEINSIGDWYWIEKDTNQPITQSIVNTIKNMIRT